MMAAAKYNLTIEQGATFSKSVAIKDSVTNLPRNLTGYFARGQVRDDYSDATPLATFTFTELDSTGTFVFGLSSAVTTALAFDSAVYDIELVLTGSIPEVVERIMQGNTFLSKEVTK